MNKCYYRIFWENYPSDNTPLNEQNLNKIDVATDEMDNRIISLDSTKFDKSEAQLLVKYIEYDEDTGIFKITHYNGASYTIDTLLEKLAINFDYDYQTQRLIIALSDGTVKYVDLSALITQYEFLDSDTVAFTVDNVGKVTAIVKEGSIEEKHLRPNYLADIKVEVAKAQASQAAADASEKEAKKSENAAKASQIAAKASEDNAAGSAVDAAESEATATQKAADAAASAATATQKATEAETSATNADNSATNASNSASVATEKATEATASATTADTYAKKSQSYAVGGTGTRPGEDTDNAKKYYEQAKEISDRLDGTLHDMGAVSFVDLPALTNAAIGDMYSVSDQFTTTDEFVLGAGHVISAWANVYKSESGKWDVFGGAPVATINGKSGNVVLAEVASSGKYKDLEEKPVFNGMKMEGDISNLFEITQYMGNQNLLLLAPKTFYDNVNPDKNFDFTIKFTNGITLGDKSYGLHIGFADPAGEGDNIEGIVRYKGSTENLPDIPAGVILQFKSYPDSTNGHYFDIVGVIDSSGGSADPGGITPESIGAVAKSGDKMTGALRIETEEGVYGLFVGKQGEDYIAITNEWIQSVDGANRAKDLELQHWGGKIVAGGKMCLRNGMNVNNGLDEVTPEAGYKYLMLFNGYTSDGTGGEVGYRNIAISGLGLHWGWCTSEIHSSGYYKIRIGHGDNENWMASFLLSVYQNYEFDLFSISGYSYLNEHWYSPKATAIDATHTSGTTIRFGYDSDGVLWIAFPAGNYTGISIDCINRAYNSGYDWVGMFELRIEETLSGTEQTQVYVQPPIKWNKASVTAAANSIVQRDSAGYIHATRFNQSSVIEGYPANMSAIFYEDNNDGYLRKMSPARMKTMLGIDELKNSVSNGKAQVASAITTKGVSTAADASFATMATNIGMISTGVRMIGVARGNKSVYFNNPANITVNFTIPDSYWQGRSRAYVLVSIWLIGSKYQVSSVNLSGDIVDSFPKSARVELDVASSATGSYSLAKKNSYSVTLTTPSEGSATYNYYGNVCMTIEYGVM